MKWLTMLFMLSVLGCSGQAFDVKKESTEAGYKAGKLGQPAEANPYPPPSGVLAAGGEKRQWWAQGWLKGDEERRKENPK